MVLFQGSRHATEAEIAVSYVVLIVLYETAPAQAQTLRTLLACDSVSELGRVIVLDHSASSQQIQCTALQPDGGPELVYEHDPTNPPLGVAYNRVVRTHLGQADYLIVLDQDTTLPRNFLEVCREVATANDQPTAMLPNIVSNGRIASPLWSVAGWGRSWAGPRSGWQSWRWCSAITSASVIHRRAFFEFGLAYSEELRFYGIDTDFFRRLGQRDPRFHVLPLTIAHSLSFDEATTVGKASKLNDVMAANRAIYAGSLWSRLGVLQTLEWTLRARYALRHRSLLFLHRTLR